MPWFDLFILAIILFGAYRGYQRGLWGALRGIIGSIFGLLAAWLVTPLAVAWVNMEFQLNEKIVLMLRKIMPDSLQEVIKKLNTAVTSLQELKQQLMQLPVPERMKIYLEAALQESNPTWQTEQTLDMMIDQMLANFAQAIQTAIMFLLIYAIVALLVRSFLGLFTSRTGIGLFGIVDGLLGMSAYVFIEMLVLTILIGALYPMIMVGGMEENSHFIYKEILNSLSAPWMNHLYLQYLLPWFA